MSSKFRRKPLWTSPSAARPATRTEWLRRALAWVRLGLLYGLLWAIILTAGLMWRQLLESNWGLRPAGPDAPHLSATGTNVALMADPAQEQQIQLNALHEAGFDWVRQRFPWPELEPAPGEFTWQAADSFVNATARSGLELVAALDGSPHWARAARDRAPADNPLAPPANPHDFARFAGAFAARYGEKIRYYQIWDEPNIAPHWGDRHIDPVAYTQLLRLAAAAIRAADSDAIIVGAALAPTADRGHAAIDEVYFLQRMYAAGAAPALDVVAIQPFGFGHAPEHTAQQAAVLNLARAGWIRRAMQAAGDKATPLWAVRYGWNRMANPTWGAVSPERQAAYAGRAVARVQGEWPWLTAMAWAIDKPHARADDARWGFALTPALTASITGPADDPAEFLMAASAGRQRAWVSLTLLGFAAVLVVWRGAAAARLLPWAAWRRRYRSQSASVQALTWIGLGVVYYAAAWPPLIGLCWIFALLLAAAQPLGALWAALALLPFYFQHKEVVLVNRTLTVPPAYVPLFALLPVLLRQATRRPRAMRSRLRMLDGLALGWLFVSLLGAANVWHWPAYGRGLVDLALAPLLLYCAVRGLATTPDNWRRSTYALLAGGTIVALVGLAGWLQGGGTEADGVRRLVGPHFSPNHTALYLERALWLGIGILMTARGRGRLIAGAASALIGLGVVLTASRGALLLGVPAGAALFVALSRPGATRRSRERAWLIAGGSAAAMLLAAAVAGIALGAPRLANSATIAARLDIWRSALALWRDLPFFGTGPDGFFWRYPAYIPAGAAMDPNLRHPHNLWLEIGTGWGVVGAVWLGLLLIALARKLLLLLQVGRDGHGAPPRGWLPLRPIAVGIAAGLIAGLAHGQVDAFAVLADLADWNWAALGLLAVFLEAAASSRKREA